MRKLIKTLLVGVLSLTTAFAMFGCDSLTNTSESSTPDTSSTSVEDASTPDESTPDESTPDESTPDESTPDESAPDESSPNEGDEDEEIHGWYNYSPDSATFEEVDGDTQIIPHGTAFGSQVILNYDLAKEITGEYRMSFVLDATEYDTGSEIWISILGAWNEALGDAFRTGLHFVDNDWKDIASYGFAQGNNLGFQDIVSNKDGDLSSATWQTKQLFPSLSSPINVDFELRYNEEEDIYGYLVFNDVLVQKVNYTALYGASFTFTDVEAVGFDIYCPVAYDIVISQVTVENIAEGEEYPQPPVDDFDGWKNYQSGESVIAREADGSISIVPKGQSFGSTLTLNSDLLKDIEGEYEVSFDLTMNLTQNTEIWLSLVGAYVDGNNLMRSGLHFFANTWNNVAFYGSVQYGNPEADVAQTGFFQVIWPEGTPDAPATFVAPSLTETVRVRETYTYDEEENIIVSLYLNDNLVGRYNLNTYYGENYGINDCTAVGFDLFISEEGCAKITNFKVSEINA